MPFLDSLDLANRAILHFGSEFIATVDEDSGRNETLSFAYDKLRRPELRRNVWTFTCKHAVLRPIDTDTMLLDPRLYDETVTYLLGALCKDANGRIWSSLIPDNLNNEPETSTAWELYFGPDAVFLYDAELSYFAGELVYVSTGSGGYVVFKSLVNDNEDDPTVGTAYDATVKYHADQIVRSGGFQWRSLIEINVGNTPTDYGALDWDETATYSSGQSVIGSDGYIYTSSINGNLGFDPVGDTGHWTATGNPNAWAKLPEQYQSSTKWMPLFASVRSLNLQYPIGCGPVSQSSTRNVYKLPHGFLREAPQNPKAGNVSYLGAPGADHYRDWVFENGYICTADSTPFVYRFVADITDVTKMDDMFCEGLAARMAFETCEKLTQASDKKKLIGAAYTQWMTEARRVNAIEQGPVEPPEDDYIACRV